MTTAYERIELPRYCRSIARTRHAGTHGAAARRRTIVGRLGRFAGVLTLRLADHDWTPADLAHLALTRLARPSRHPAAPREPTATTHDSPSADDQPRVRDVLRTESATSADPAEPSDWSASDSHERHGPFDIGVLLKGATPPQPAPIIEGGRRDGSEARPGDATEQSRHTRPRDEPADQHTVDSSQARPSRPFDRSTSGGPPARTTVIRRQVDAGRASPDRTATGGETDASPPSGALSTDDPPRQAVTHPTVTHTGDGLGRTPDRVTRFRRHHRRARDRSGVVRLAGASRDDRSGPGATSGVAEPSAPPMLRHAGASRDDRGGPGATSGVAEPSAPAMLRPAAGHHHEPVRLKPLDVTAPAAGRPPVAGASSTARPAGRTGDGPPDDRRDAPPLVVRRPPTPRRGDPDGQPDTTDTAPGAPRDRQRDDPRTGHPLSGATNGSPAGQSVGASAGQRDARSPERLDELIDVDALVVRLTRAFERAARIERERRGR